MLEKILIVAAGAMAGAAMMQATYIVRGRKSSQNDTELFKDSLKKATDFKTKFTVLKTKFEDRKTAAA